MKTINVATIVYDEVEEAELFVPHDLMIRSGFNSVFFSLDGKNIKTTFGTELVIEKSFEDIDWNNFDAIFIPGGRGIDNISNSEKFNKIVQDFYQKNKYIFAICSGVKILGTSGISENKNLTGAPNIYDFIKNSNILDTTVCVDEKIITAKGLADTYFFGIQIAKTCFGNNSKNVKNLLQKLDSKIFN